MGWTLSHDKRRRHGNEPNILIQGYACKEGGVPGAITPIQGETGQLTREIPYNIQKHGFNIQLHTCLPLTTTIAAMSRRRQRFKGPEPNDPLKPQIIVRTEKETSRGTVSSTKVVALDEKYMSTSASRTATGNAPASPLNAGNDIEMEPPADEEGDGPTSEESSRRQTKVG